ncbi:hypothetical protein AKJ16_DCAP19741 [Drosera capensis]
MGLVIEPLPVGGGVGMVEVVVRRSSGIRNACCF